MKPCPILTLVAEDSEDERILLHRALRQLPNLKVTTFVNDGADAIEYLEGAGRFSDRRVFPFPDLLLLDLQMPRCSGMDVLEFLRYQPARPSVVLWSNAPQLLDHAQALQLGADLVCEKPLGVLELMQVVSHLAPVLSHRTPAYTLHRTRSVH